MWGGCTLLLLKVWSIVDCTLDIETGCPQLVSGGQNVQACDATLQSLPELRSRRQAFICCSNSIVPFPRRCCKLNVESFLVICIYGDLSKKRKASCSKSMHNCLYSFSTWASSSTCSLNFSNAFLHCQ